MIVVTGGSRGLGGAIADRLASRGERVIRVSRGGGDGDDDFACDVTDPDALKACARVLRREDEPVTALVNAAGVAAMNLVLTTPPSVTRHLIETNLMGTIFACQAFSPLMIRQKAGCIVNFSTIAVSLALEGEAVYAASKAGVEVFSRTFAREVSAAGVRVNCIAPGPVRTDLLRGVSDEQIKAITDRQVDKREASLDDVADLVELLLGPQASALSGEVLHVKGV